MGLDRLLCVLPCAALLATCSGSPSAPTVPDIRGSWRGVPYSWNWTDNFSLDPGSKGAANCAGTLVITSQDGGSFGGRYRIDDCAADGSSGAVLDGHIGANGQLSFELVAEKGWGPGLLPYWDETDCRLSEDSGVYEGSLSRDTLSVHRVQILTCSSGAGRAVVNATFQGVRQ